MCQSSKKTSQKGRLPVEIESQYYLRFYLIYKCIFSIIKIESKLISKYCLPVETWSQLQLDAFQLRKSLNCISGNRKLIAIESQYYLRLFLLYKCIFSIIKIESKLNPKILPSSWDWDSVATTFVCQRKMYFWHESCYENSCKILYLVIDYIQLSVILYS
jgi:hypothetical protein